MQIASISSYQRKYRKTFVCVVELDSGEKLELEPETAVRFDLRTRDTLDETKYQAIRAFDEKKKCIAEAMNLISLRPRSRQELQERFLRKGYSSESVEDSLTKLMANGYLNDAEFARRWSRSKLKKKSIGRNTLQFELRKKGISGDVINSVMKEIYSVHNEFEDALAAANKKIRTYRDEDVSAIRSKLMRFLHQRGFSQDSIRTALDTLLK